MNLDETAERVDRLLAGSPKRQLVERYMSIFSRMEYALKESKFFIRQDGKAEANWDAFAMSVGDLRKVQDARVQAAIALFETNPPREQIVIAGKLDWREIPLQDKTNAALFLMVRRIRNNLFHGGKVPWVPRDEELLQAGISLMIAALALNDEVCKRFTYPDPFATV